MKHRELAIKWWDSQKTSDKAYMMLGYFKEEKRLMASLTGREIENLWYHYVKSDAEIIEETFKNRGTQRSPFGIGV